MRTVGIVVTVIGIVFWISPGWLYQGLVLAGLFNDENGFVAAINLGRTISVTPWIVVCGVILTAAGHLAMHAGTAREKAEPKPRRAVGRTVRQRRVYRARR